MRRYKFWDIIIVLVVICSYTAMLLWFPGNNLKLEPTSVSRLDGPWYFSSEKYEQELSLPANLEVDRNQTYTLSLLLDERFDDPTTLMYRSPLQYLKVYLNDELIYQNFDIERQLPPIASMWNIINLPDQADGKTLVFEIQSPYQSMASQVNSVYYGEPGSLYLTIIKNHGFLFGISIIVILLSLILLLLSNFFVTHTNRQSRLISLFTLSLGFWLLAESRMLQFVVANQLLHASLAYIMLTIFLIPFLVNIKDYVVEKSQWVYQFLIAMHVVWAALVILFQLFNIYDFFETIRITNILIIFSIVTTMITMSIEIIKYHNKKAVEFLRNISVLIIFGLIELAYFFNNYYGRTGHFLVIGLFIFLIIRTVEYVLKAVAIIQNSKMAEQYKILANLDPLTQAKNRRAFDKQIMDIVVNQQHNQVRIIFFDLNELKKINDLYGHAIGDDALIQVNLILVEVFNEAASIYRVGGDEFACILFNVNEAYYLERINHLEALIEKCKFEFDFKISYGSAVFDDTLDQKISDTLQRADLEMYKHKFQKEPN